MFYKYSPPEKYADLLPNNKIVRVSYTDYDNEPSLIHSHKKSTEVVFVRSGEGSIVYQESEIDIKPNTIYFINPNTDHTEISKRKLRYYVMTLNHFEVLDKNKMPIKTLQIPSADYGNFLSLLDMAITESSKPDGNEAYVVALLSAVFFKIQNIIRENSTLGIFDHIDNYSSIVKSCMNYINIYFSEITAVDELCRKFNVSQRSLERLFMQELNISPVSYLKKVRLEKAAALLRASSFSISQISSMCGYSSFAYFTKEFKAAYGATPSKYRISE